MSDNSSYNYTTVPHSKQVIEASWRLQKIILNSLDFKDVVQKIVNSMFTELENFKLGYKIIVLALVDKESGILKRISISRTPEAAKAISLSPIQFENIDIPLSAANNLSIKVLNSREPAITNYWPDILCPAYTVDEAINIQKLVGIKSSLVYPIVSKNKSLGIMIFSMQKGADEISPEEKELILDFTDMVGIAVQNSELYSHLENTMERLRKANNKLLEVDKLKDEFVSLASHELRTPMTVIKSYSWLLLQGKTGNMNSKPILFLDRVYSSTNRLINLVNDMLNVSRIESGRITIDKKEVNIKQLIDDVITEMMPKAQEGKIELSVNYQENLPCVMVDPDKIKEVIINLVGNSLKFTPENGKITINITQKDGEIIVKVSDTGAGIDKDDIQKLFQKFGIVGNNYLRKQNTQGTGLGLYLAKSLVELHGGRMWVESEGLGKGSNFYFTIMTVNQEGKIPQAFSKINSD